MVYCGMHLVVVVVVVVVVFRQAVHQEVLQVLIPQVWVVQEVVLVFQKVLQEHLVLVQWYLEYVHPNSNSKCH
jgi:hypothetical protein